MYKKMKARKGTRMTPMERIKTDIKSAKIRQISVIRVRFISKIKKQESSYGVCPHIPSAAVQ